MTGEKVIYTNECVACPKDKYSIIDNANECKLCPQHAKCPGK